MKNVKNRKKGWLFLLLFFLGLALVVITLFLPRVTHKRESSSGKYPESSLLPEPSEEVPVIPYFLTKSVSLPGTDLHVALPDRAVSYEEDAITFGYNYYHIYIGAQGEDDFSKEVSDTGYLVDKEVRYAAGEKDGRYYVSYQVTIDNTNLWYILSTNKLVYLSDGKALLESMILSTGLQPLSSEPVETPLEEETEDDRLMETSTEETSTEEESDDSFVAETDSLGTTRYQSSKEVEVLTDSSHDNYIVFRWSEADNAPSNATLRGPMGKRYFPDKSESFGATMVFHVSDAENFTYTLEVTTLESLGNCTVNSYTKADYYAIFYNQDENGNPIRYFEEEE